MPFSNKIYSIVVFLGNKALSTCYCHAALGTKSLSFFLHFSLGFVCRI